jgi:hypothetical protein
VSLGSPAQSPLLNICRRLRANRDQSTNKDTYERPNEVEDETDCF